MAKASGIGATLIVNGYNLSGDVGVINSIHDSQNLLDVTGLDKGAMERIPGLADGDISFTAFFNDALSAAHPVLSAMGTGDKTITVIVGSGGWAMVGKQVDYAGTRGADGSLAFQVSFQSSDGQGLSGGEVLA